MVLVQLVSEHFGRIYLFLVLDCWSVLYCSSDLRNSLIYGCFSKFETVPGIGLYVRVHWLMYIRAEDIFIRLPFLALMSDTWQSSNKLISRDFSPYFCTMDEFYRPYIWAYPPPN